MFLCMLVEQLFVQKVMFAPVPLLISTAFCWLAGRCNLSGVDWTEKEMGKVRGLMEKVSATAL